MKPAEKLVKDIKARITDIDSIIKKGNAAWNRLNTKKSLLKGRTVTYRGKEHAGNTLTKELVSYGKEKNILNAVIDFYEEIGAVEEF